MKKYFKYAAVLAAGMLASCGTDSLTGSDPKIEPTQEDGVAIEISVATPQLAASGATRGTGTVGGVELANGTAVNNDGSEVGAKNIWAGQTVNVYMFEKGTLNVAKFNSTAIFDNAEMVTPPASENTASGLAYQLEGGRKLIKYYPMSGAFDFWGYRIDDAVTTGAPAVNDGKLNVGITVDGTQDVLGAKTTEPVLTGTTLAAEDIYSAKAARQDIQPILEFNHLMTRLTFEAYPGNANAKSVYVTGIKVRPLEAYSATDTTYIKNVGVLDIAGNGEGFVQKITWETDDNELTADDQYQYELMKRADVVLGKDAYEGIAANSWYKLNADEDNKAEFITTAAYYAIDKIKNDYEVLAAASYYALVAASGDNTQFITAAAYALLDDADKLLYEPIAENSWYELVASPGVVNSFISAAVYADLPEHAQGEYSALDANSWYALTAAITDNTKFITPAAYGALPATTNNPVNENLVALTDGSTNWATNGAVSMTFGTGATDGSEKAPIGESIIAPDAQAYVIEIDLAQKVAKYEDSDENVDEDWTEYQFNSVKTVVKLDGGETRFLPGYTYDFIFKVYGLEKIEVTTVLKPWIWGENQTIVTE